MIKRLPVSTLLVLLGLAGVAGVAGCGGSNDADAAFGKAPAGLPADVAFNLAVYDHAKEVSNLPHGIEKVGTTRGSGIMYAPTPRTDHPRTVWVTRGDRVWKYTFDFKMKLQ